MRKKNNPKILLSFNIFLNILRVLLWRNKLSKFDNGRRAICNSGLHSTSGLLLPVKENWFPHFLEKEKKSLWYPKCHISAYPQAFVCPSAKEKQLPTGKWTAQSDRHQGWFIQGLRQANILSVAVEGVPARRSLEQRSWSCTADEPTTSECMAMLPSMAWEGWVGQPSASEGILLGFTTVVPEQRGKNKAGGETVQNEHLIHVPLVQFDNPA